MKISTRLNMLAVAISVGLLGACASNHTSEQQAASASAQSAVPASSLEANLEANIAAESAKANALFDALFMDEVMASPISQTYLGMKTQYGQWDEISDQATDAAITRAKQGLVQLAELNPQLLDPQTRLSLTLLTQELEQRISDDKWRYHNYPVNQMRGAHSHMVSFLINQHRVDSLDDAKAYISRLNGMATRLQQVQYQLALRAEKGIIAPRFVFPHVISDSQNIITGFPFSDGEDSVLWEDFNKKVKALELDADTEESLLASAKQALTESVEPGYVRFIAYVKELAKKSDQTAGVWKLPDGDAFYNNALARTTTTDLTAEEIHQTGLAEVERIHNEMRVIMQRVGFNGDLPAFFAHMRDSEQFYYPDTEQGREDYLRDATAMIDNMSARLDEVFKVKPKAPMITKRVEAFREKSAGKAFYNSPAPDGSRPGIYYANLYKMKAMPKYQMEALAYHEGIPGHHMQLSIAQELEGIPKFRKFGGYTAFIEGWGLYSEYFPKEMGLYSDPYSDFGRLAMELWRACRLVVDTGIHHKKWTREQGIAFYSDNTPNAKSDVIKMVERHVVMPSQATAYKVGMLKILELREKAKKALGSQFELSDFHTLVLSNGALPLSVLETQIDNWIAAKQSQPQA